MDFVKTKKQNLEAGRFRSIVFLYTVIPIIIVVIVVSVAVSLAAHRAGDRLDSPPKTESSNTFGVVAAPSQSGVTVSVEGAQTWAASLGISAEVGKRVPSGFTVTNSPSFFLSGRPIGEVKVVAASLVGGKVSDIQERTFVTARGLTGNYFVDESTHYVLDWNDRTRTYSLWVKDQEERAIAGRLSGNSLLFENGWYMDLVEPSPSASPDYDFEGSKTDLFHS